MIKDNIKKINKFSFIIVVILLTISTSYATDLQNNAFSAVSGPLEQIMRFISGPIAQMVGVICIVIAGLGIAFGEGGSGVKRLFQIVFGLAIAFTATSLITGLFHSSSGIVF